MRRCKVDRNQKEIVEAFRKLGFSVAHTHMVGEGFVDIVIGKNGKNYLIEIKDGLLSESRKKLTTAEQKFHDEWRGQKAIIESVEDVIEFAKQN
jgi:Holliday junction resolvase